MDCATRAGIGRAFGAVTILNATATGIGAALAVEAGATCNWAWGAAGLRLAGAPDDRLVGAIQDRHGAGRGATVHCTTTFPAGRGLKTSASAATALLRAAQDADAKSLDDRELLRQAVAATRAAGVTLTGALDDQVAVTLGGAHLTDNRRDAILQRLPIERWHVAVWVPDVGIDKTRLASLDTGPIVRWCREAEHLATRGRLAEALTRNGAAFTRLYAAANLPVDDRPSEVARIAGALGAGLSGTGPAVAALFDAPTNLPAVPGGTWTWTRVVEAAT